MTDTVSRERRSEIMRKTLTDYERGWLEALIDGEGCISFKKEPRRHIRRGYLWRVFLIIANTNRDIIYRARELIGGGKVILKKSYHNPKYRDVYSLEVGHTFLTHILPQLRLIVKERERQLALEAIRLVSENYRASRRFLLDNNFRAPHDKQLRQIWEEAKSLKWKVGQKNGHNE